MARSAAYCIVRPFSLSTDPSGPDRWLDSSRTARNLTCSHSVISCFPIDSFRKTLVHRCSGSSPGFLHVYADGDSYFLGSQTPNATFCYFPVYGSCWWTVKPATHDPASSSRCRPSKTTADITDWCVVAFTADSSGTVDSVPIMPFCARVTTNDKTSHCWLRGRTVHLQETDESIRSVKSSANPPAGLPWKFLKYDNRPSQRHTCQR